MQVGFHMRLAIEEVEWRHRDVMTILDFGDVTRGRRFAMFSGLGYIRNFEQVLVGELLLGLGAQVARVIGVYKNSNVTGVRGVGCGRKTYQGPPTKTASYSGSVSSPRRWRCSGGWRFGSSEFSAKHSSHCLLHLYYCLRVTLPLFLALILIKSDNLN